MSKLKSCLQLIRVKHWLKNIIVFIPAFYGGVFLEMDILIGCVVGFITFAACSSAIYVMNDLCDIENDRLHPVKRKRPLASGAVSPNEGRALFAVCCAVAVASDLWLCGLSLGAAIPLIYLILNGAYSFKLKNRPVTDIVILVSGFVFRMLYGAVITDVRISKWLYLTLISLSLFMAFGKRRNEKRTCGDSTRSVLAKYTENYLNSSMYMYLALFLVFYALWSVDTSALPGMIYTTPLVIVMIMRYTYSLESDEHGNPVDMILGDKILLILGAVYALFVLSQIYFPEVINERIRF